MLVNGFIILLIYFIIVRKKTFNFYYALLDKFLIIKSIIANDDMGPKPRFL